MPKYCSAIDLFILTVTHGIIEDGGFDLSRFDQAPTKRSMVPGVFLLSKLPSGVGSQDSYSYSKAGEFTIVVEPLQRRARSIVASRARSRSAQAGSVHSTSLTRDWKKPVEKSINKIGRAHV